MGGQEQRISAAVTTDGDHVLMVLREGVWQFPSGCCAAGESVQDAAVRGTWKETELTVGAEQVLGEHVVPETGHVVSYTACTPVAGEARVADGTGLDAVDWVPPRELPDYMPNGLYGPVQAYLRELA